MRADLYLFTSGHTKSRQKAKSLIENSCVKIDNMNITKPSFEVDDTIEHSVEIVDSCLYVSRGGLKLEAIIKHESIDVKNKVCLDIGASTGGFTDCLLQNGAKLVYAVDSGTNQLDLKLKNNDKVISIEGFNARNITFDVLKNKPDIVTIDVSFISQTLIMPSALDLLDDEGVYLSLIKPQFEVGKANIGKGGIVKDKIARKNAILRVIECAKSKGFNCTSLIKSPIFGGDGNIEYLAVFKKCNNSVSDEEIKKIINS